jgi:hypothetical protein
MRRSGLEMDWHQYSNEEVAPAEAEELPEGMQCDLRKVCERVGRDPMRTLENVAARVREAEKSPLPSNQRRKEETSGGEEEEGEAEERVHQRNTRRQDFAGGKRAQSRIAARGQERERHRTRPLQNQEI